MGDDFAKWDALLRTSRDRSQAEQIARACGVPIRPEGPVLPPVDKESFAARLAAARVDPGTFEALARDLARPTVGRDDLIELAAVFGAEVQARARRLPKAKQIELLREAVAGA